MLLLFTDGVVPLFTYMQPMHVLNMSYYLLIFSVFLQCSCYSKVQSEIISDFLSVPTTVKAQENNTVLLPCYLNTGSNNNGKFLQFAKYCNTYFIELLPAIILSTARK